MQKVLISLGKGALAVGMLALILLVAAPQVFGQNVANYMAQGTGYWYIGSYMHVLSGGTIVLDSGSTLDVSAGTVTGSNITVTTTAASADLNMLTGMGSLAGTATASKAAVLGAYKNLDVLALPAGGLHIGTNAGTSVTATAAELNVLHSVTAGTAAASSAAVLGANKNLDTLVLPVGGLYIGPTAGTSVTSTAAELNSVHGMATQATITATADGTTQYKSDWAIQVKDATGTNIAYPALVIVTWSAASTGAGMAAASSGAWAASTGVILFTLVSQQLQLCQTNATGALALTVIDNSKGTNYVVVYPTTGGVPSISAQLTSGSYHA